jgi:diaminopimelate epimerase
MTRFTKVHALGNDFVVICRSEGLAAEELADFARGICDRHTGVGCDGLLLVKDAVEGEDVFEFRIFNADGTEAEISGNGLRCATACLVSHGRIKSSRVNFQTSAGLRACEIIENKGPLFDIKIDMGAPRLTSKEIPFDDGEEHPQVVDYPMSISKRVHPVTCVSMGNPHCDIFVERFPARIEWHQVGGAIETHPFFPHRTNVEFVHVLNRSEIEVLFWERGVGETLSSGSGSCAAAVTSILKGLTDRKVKVWTSMGPFVVEWPPGGSVYQTGPAQIVFEGDYLS